MMLRTLLAYALLTAFLPEMETSQASQELKGKQVNLSQAPLSVAGCAVVHVLGRELTFGNSRFATSTDGRTTRVATAPGKLASSALSSGKITTFRWREGDANREISLRFVQVDGAWTYYNAQSRVFSIQGSAFELIDCDADGVFGELEQDGYRAYGSPFVCPLANELVIGAHLVSLERLGSDGTRLKLILKALNGTSQQIECLARINWLRAANGLPHVVLDEALSSAATAHANYLDLHAWNGYTDPHVQSLGEEGQSKEGRESAQRSLIGKHSPREGAIGFWYTYYHRITLMSPLLDCIGVNATPSSIAVIDTSNGFKSGAAARTWTEPIFVPADGAVGVPLNSRAELPEEPVPKLESRGFCLMVAFPLDEQGVTAFSGSLEEVQKRGNVEVPTLLAAQSRWKWTFGIVPEGPLKPNTRYIAKFKCLRNGAPYERTISFQTE